MGCRSGSTGRAVFFSFNLKFVCFVIFFDEKPMGFYLDNYIELKCSHWFSHHFQDFFELKSQEL